MIDETVRWTNYLIAHRHPVYGDPLPQPVVVAAITCDPRFIGRINPVKELATLAGKMGVLDFEVSTSEAQDRPGHQLGLPFPPT